MKLSKKVILKNAMSKKYCGETYFDFLDEEEKPLIYKAMEDYAKQENLSKNDRIIIEIPKGFFNIEISTCNHLIADTNDSANWDTIKLPLPMGEWVIAGIKDKIVTLKNLNNINEVHG